MNRFATVVENASGATTKDVPSAGQATASPAKGEKNTKDAETNWDSYPDNDDYDPYDDDMYENHDLSEHLQAICDDLDIPKEQERLPEVCGFLFTDAIRFIYTMSAQIGDEDTIACWITTGESDPYLGRQAAITNVMFQP
ncbi:hypothetical protein Tco_1131932 [Tanacetum coccineum]|uniref:Uncharacterized protein n=1 Tax=Tanacetum coccineum TaxID=301880 RepID=A0ABQ5JAH6_9ASTR